MATILSVIAWFLTMGIHTSQRAEDGTPQRTTGRLPGGLAFYATSPRPSGKDSWKSKDGSRGGTKALAVINTPAQVDAETGEVMREESTEYVDVLFPHVVAYQKGDHILARGTWQAGKAFVRQDGSPARWNDSLFVSDFAIIPAAVREAAKLTTITVSEPTPVEPAPLSEAAASFIADMEAAAPAPARKRR